MPIKAGVRLIALGLSLGITSFPFPVYAAPINWFNFNNPKLDQEGSAAIIALDDGLSNFFRLITSIRQGQSAEFDVVRSEVDKQLVESAKNFSVLALLLPNTDFNTRDLTPDEAKTFVELRGKFINAGLIDPDKGIKNGKEFFDVVAKLVDRFRGNILKLGLKENDPKLFATIIYDKILIEQVGSTAQVISAAMK